MDPTPSRDSKGVEPQYLKAILRSLEDTGKKQRKRHARRPHTTRKDHSVRPHRAS
jgi:hypothetical protein